MPSGSPGLTLLLALAVCAPASGQAPLYRAHTPQGLLRGLRLDQFVDDGLIHLSGKESKIFPTADLIELRREGVPLPERPSPPFLLLANGECWPLAKDEPVRWHDNRLSVKPAGLRVVAKDGLLSVPVAYVAALCLASPPGEPPLERRLMQILSAGRKQDLVLLTDGDQVEGAVVALDDRIVEARSAARLVKLPASRLALVVPSSESRIKPRFKGPHHLIVIRQGARVNLQHLALDAERGVWQGKTSGGVVVEIARGDVVGVATRQGRAVYLSDLKPSDFKRGETLGWTDGASPACVEHVLRLSDGVYDHGLCLTAPSQIDFTLDGKYAWFEARLGLNPRANPLARARVSLKVDGKVIDLADGKELTASTPPLDIRVDLASARSLSLVTDPGSRPGLAPAVIWANARLTR